MIARNIVAMAEESVAGVMAVEERPNLRANGWSNLSNGCRIASRLG
jgi:hypothetical protein